MITAQDIREKTFEKAVFGGYDMGTIDAFLEEVANDYALLQKENAVLKGKMKVLVGKVEEYRSNEDALRLAVLSAQRLANMIETEAKEKAEKIVSDANAEAARVTQEAALQVEMEKGRLQEAKNASLQFIDNMNLLCRRQMAFLDDVAQLDFVAQAKTEQAAPQAEAEIHETVKSIEETVSKEASAPVSTVKPDVSVLSQAKGDSPTQVFSIVTEPEDDLEATNQFSFDGFDFK